MKVSVRLPKTTNGSEAEYPRTKGFFMHIAKTAGSFMNSLFANAIGDYFVEHCEDGKRLNTGKDILLWSGHIYLERWKQIEKERGWNMKHFTLLREPLSQLSSHILWLDHYGQEEFKEEFNLLDSETQQVVREVSETDLSDAGDIDRLLVHLSGRGIMYLDNMQSRYFICGSKDIKRDTQLHLGMRSIVQNAFSNFHAIGTDKDIPGFVENISEEMGIEIPYVNKRVNDSKSHRSIDLKNSQVVAVLSKRITLDRWLYNKALSANS